MYRRDLFNLLINLGKDVDSEEIFDEMGSHNAVICYLKKTYDMQVVTTDGMFPFKCDCIEFDSVLQSVIFIIDEQEYLAARLTNIKTIKAS